MRSDEIEMGLLLPSSRLEGLELGANVAFDTVEHILGARGDRLKYIHIRVNPEISSDSGTVPV